MKQLKDVQGTKADAIMEIGIVLIVLAFLPLFVGFLFGFGNAITNLGIILMVIGVPTLIFGIVLKAREKELPPPLHTITKEKEIIKEVVMIPCQYCDGLMPQTSTYCPHCGARREV